MDKILSIDHRRTALTTGAVLALTAASKAEATSNIARELISSGILRLNALRRLVGLQISGD